MFNTCKEAIAFMEQQRTKRTLSQFEDTLKKYNISTTLPYTVHIAGTNGKGSTVQYVKEILMGHGYQVGTFTSPYMVEHNDRICINGEPISDEDLLMYSNQVVPIIKQEKLSMFEIDVLIMLLYFNDAKLDFCIIETGIGGKEDKTNVITSKISAITNIGLDHQEMLGNTLHDIASHKAGIIKEDSLFITSETDIEILKMFSNVCKDKNTIMEVITKEEGKQFHYHNNIYTINQLASYQIYNAKLAVVIASHCITLQLDMTQKALNQFTYPGRFEKIGNVYLDGAHNIEGIRALHTSIKQLKLDNVCIIFSTLSDKDSKPMLDILADYPVKLASFNDDRMRIKAKDYKEVWKEVSTKYDTIIFTGSLHFVSRVRKDILKKL